MPKLSTKIIAALAALMATPALALAAAAPVTLDSAIKLDKLVDGHHAWVAPQKVVPGNHLLFTTTYHNTTAKPVEHFVVTNPVPAAVALEEAPAAEVSVDGGKSFGPLASLKVATPGGALRAAEPADVTHVRFVVPAIAPGATGTLEYHAVVR